jgi:hypothetical protein
MRRLQRERGAAIRCSALILPSKPFGRFDIMVAGRGVLAALPV